MKGTLHGMVLAGFGVLLDGAASHATDRMRPALLASTYVLGLLAVGLAATTVQAVDVPITGLKLIVVDKIVAAGSAKAVFLAKDAAITKGPGTDPTQIAATLDIAYGTVSGTFDMPQGSNWLVNSDTLCKYVNKTAPTGGAVKVSVIKPGSFLKVASRSLGDTPLDISIGNPSGGVYVSETVLNGADTTRLCTKFTPSPSGPTNCAVYPLAGGTGRKLVCWGPSTGDPACTAAVLSSGTTTTTSTTTSTLPCTPIYSSCGTCGSGVCYPLCPGFPQGITCLSITSVACATDQDCAPGDVCRSLFEGDFCTGGLCVTPCP